MRIRDVRIFASPTENASRPFHRSVGSSRGGRRAHMQARRRSIVVAGVPLLEQIRHDKLSRSGLASADVGLFAEMPSRPRCWVRAPSPDRQSLCVAAQPLVDARDCVAVESLDPLPHEARVMDRGDAGVAQRSRGQPCDGDAYRIARGVLAAPNLRGLHRQMCRIWPSAGTGT